jgi:hypothetical protein
VLRAFELAQSFTRLLERKRAIDDRQLESMCGNGAVHFLEHSNGPYINPLHTSISHHDRKNIQGLLDSGENTEETNLAARSH